MRKYHNNSSTSHRIAYGIDLQAGLEQLPETRSLAAELGVLNEELARIQMEAKPKEMELSRARARVRFANYGFDNVLRQVATACEAADGGKRGTLFHALFPDNLIYVIESASRRQVLTGTHFLQRLETSNAPGVDAVRAAWMPRIQAALAELKNALDARDAALAELSMVRAREEALCDDHEIAVERIMGQIRALFPRQRELWDTVFPPVRHSSRDSHRNAESDGADTP